MTIKQMVVKRFTDILKEKNMAINELAVISGITPSTVYSMMQDDRGDVSVSTVKKLCDGLEITIGEFFSTPDFDNLDQEIK